MKYYIIVGEASGDLHASRLMKSLKTVDLNADFRFFGGDLMTAVGGVRVKHYKELAFMGFIPVLLHLNTIIKNMALCRNDITKWRPDCVILVDYPGFNLDMAQFVHDKLHIPVYYYISPKIWAWKEYRIRSIKRNVNEMFSILPFEIPFYEERHNYPIHYVGNPTVEEVNYFQKEYHQTFEEFCSSNNLDSSKQIIALLAGSRIQEIKDNLPAMIEAASNFSDYQMVLAGAPAVNDKFYEKFINGTGVKIVKNLTYPLLSHAKMALVTSGTATLETALFKVPQVVCYETPVPKLIRFGFNHIIKVKFISLVNLIAEKEVVSEMLADRFTVNGLTEELYKIMPGSEGREIMLKEYEEVRKRLGSEIAPDNAATIMYDLLMHPTAGNNQSNDTTSTASDIPIGQFPEAE